MNPFRLQYGPDPKPEDRCYDLRSSAKAQLTKKARESRSFGWRVVDQRNGEVWVYDSNKGKVVKL